MKVQNPASCDVKQALKIYFFLFASDFGCLFHIQNELKSSNG